MPGAITGGRAWLEKRREEGNKERGQRERRRDGGCNDPRPRNS